MLFQHKAQKPPPLFFEHRTEPFDARKFSLFWRLMFFSNFAIPFIYLFQFGGSSFFFVGQMNPAHEFPFSSFSIGSGDARFFFIFWLFRFAFARMRPVRAFLRAAATALQSFAETCVLLAKIGWELPTPRGHVAELAGPGRGDATGRRFRRFSEQIQTVFGADSDGIQTVFGADSDGFRSRFRRKKPSEFFVWIVWIRQHVRFYCIFEIQTDFGIVWIARIWIAFWKEPNSFCLGWTGVPFCLVRSGLLRLRAVWRVPGEVVAVLCFETFWRVRFGHFAE